MQKPKSLYTLLATIVLGNRLKVLKKYVSSTEILAVLNSSDGEKRVSQDVLTIFDLVPFIQQMGLRQPGFSRNMKQRKNQNG